MKSRFALCLAVCLLLLLSSLPLHPSSASVVRAEGVVIVNLPTAAAAAPDATWYFAVSGDSRDCGDLIMPKIARAIKDNKTPIKFYWHLGDFRRIFQPDCDIATRLNPGYNCEKHPKDPKVSLDAYIKGAWQDFIERQVAPFKDAVPRVYLGIGNHELSDYARDDGSKGTLTREQFKSDFKKWLTWGTLKDQVKADVKRNIPSRVGETYYHFIIRSVDFIYLDNAANNTFTEEQITWLAKVLEADQRDDDVKTIIVGMHEALPFSVSEKHAMDASCDGLCTGKRVYRMLYKMYKPAQPGVQPKQVYVLASHSHYFQKDAFNTTRHIKDDDVLPGWIIGTAGAEQYQDTIKYGYAQIAVHPDGTIKLDFVEVGRDSPPLLKDPGITELTSFCFERNKKKQSELPDSHKDDSQCPKCQIE